MGIPRISELVASNEGLQDDLQSLADAKRGGEDECRAQLADLAAQKDVLTREGQLARAEAAKHAHDLSQLQQVQSLLDSCQAC